MDGWGGLDIGGNLTRAGSENQGLMGPEKERSGSTGPTLVFGILRHGCLVKGHAGHGVIPQESLCLY